MGQNPPVALFVYNRPDHVRKTLEALEKNIDVEKFHIYIFSDAAKDDASVTAVKATRDLVRNFHGLHIVEIFEQERNVGLADSIVQGVSRLVHEHGSVIVLEDDLVTSPYFLTFMSEALMRYRDDRRIMHINGFSLPIGLKSSGEDVYAFRQTLSWGWATWKDRWQSFEQDAEILLKRLESRDLLKRLDMDGHFRFSSTLKANARGDIHTWAVKWFASVILEGGIALTPYCSLVQNIGHDDSGTNATLNKDFETELCREKPSVNLSEFSEQPEVTRAVIAFYKSIRPSVWRKVATRIGYITKRHKV